MNTNVESSHAADANSNESGPTKRLGGWRNMLIYVAGVLIFMMTVMALQVDDWKRDLTNNFAETDANAKQEWLRPVHLAMTTSEAEQVIRLAADRLPRWKVINADEGNAEEKLHLTRTTRWFRFVDDVWVSFHLEGDNTRIEISSRSRVGKGDLGQNPRNIRELRQEIDRLVGEAQSTR